MQTTPSAAADLAACPHDRGPGTTICLRCRADSHRAAAVARRTLMTRGAIAAVAVAGVFAMGGNALAARSGGGSTKAAPRATTLTVTEESAAPAATSPSAATAPSASAAPAPLVAEGRTELAGGAWAERTGGNVVVHFDTQLLRTRRYDKFDQTVRATLPAVYGPMASAALDALPPDAMARMGGLLTELPTRGVRLPAQDGWAITLYPGTRQGQDGPLVVRYRIAVAAAR